MKLIEPSLYGFISIALSRRNLLELTALLDAVKANGGSGDSALIMRKVNDDFILLVVAEEDEVHYADRPDMLAAYTSTNSINEEVGECCMADACCPPERRNACTFANTLCPYEGHVDSIGEDAVPRCNGCNC